MGSVVHGPSSVTYRRRLVRLKSKQWRDLRDTELLRLYRLGYTRRELADALGLSVRQVIRRLKIYTDLNPALKSERLFDAVRASRQDRERSSSVRSCRQRKSSKTTFRHPDH